MDHFIVIDDDLGVANNCGNLQNFQLFAENKNIIAFMFFI